MHQILNFNATSIITIILLRTYCSSNRWWHLIHNATVYRQNQINKNFRGRSIFSKKNYLNANPHQEFFLINV